jgi:hypothetical protein
MTHDEVESMVALRGGHWRRGRPLGPPRRPKEDGIGEILRATTRVAKKKREQMEDRYVSVAPISYLPVRA